MNNPFDVLDARLSNIENILLDIRRFPQIESTREESTCWLNLPELCKYLPDKPKTTTVYTWTMKRLIPFHKSGKKLRFLKSEIDEWLLNGRQRTISEIAGDASSYLKTKNTVKL